MTEPEKAAPAAPAREKRARIPLHWQILAAMAVGLVLGPILGDAAGPFGELGKMVITLIKTIATPLVFLLVVKAILTTKLRLGSGGRLLGWALLNASIALAIGLLLSNLIRPGEYLSVTPPDDAERVAQYEGREVDFVQAISGIVPTSVVGPFVENQILSVVLLALLFGFGLRRVRASKRKSSAALERGIALLLRTTEVVLGWVIALVPLAVFGVVTKAVGENGYAPFRGLAVYVAVGLLGLALHIGITYHAWLLLFTKKSIREFWAAAKEPVFYAMGANSSLATLPVTLRALDRLKVSKASSTLGAVVGTNFNNDGIILYEGMAVLFVAQASGIDLTLGQQLLVAAAALVAAMGVAGVPEAGFISLALVLNTVNLPVELLPLLLTVDWIVARARSVTNVLSDMMLSLLVDRSRPPDSEETG